MSHLFFWSIALTMGRVRLFRMKAFIKQPLAVAGAFGEIKCYPNCFAELNTSLGIIFIANIVVGNVGEIAPAIIKAKLKTAAESKGSTLADAGTRQ